MTAQFTKEEALRENIIQVAQQLFQRYGLRKVTMDDIARAAGRGKSSLYYYYKSKDEIFDVVLGREISDMLAQLTQQIEHLPSASAQLEAFAITKLQLLREKTALYGMLYQDIYEYYSLEFANRTRLRYQANEIAVVKRILVSGIAQAEFRKLSENEIAQVAVVIITSLYGFNQQLLTTGVQSDLEPNLRLFVQLMVRGLQS